MKHTININLLMITFILLLNNLVYSQDIRWIYFSESYDGKWYYDNISIEYKNSTISLWLKVVRNPNSTDDNRTYELHSVILYCIEKKICTKTVYVYYPNDDFKKGDLNKYEDIPPESNTEALYLIFCKN
jgi:hypothetical protein